MQKEYLVILPTKNEFFGGTDKIKRVLTIKQIHNARKAHQKVIIKREITTHKHQAKKTVKHHNTKSNGYNRFQHWIKRSPYNYDQVIKIIKKYDHWKQSLKGTKKRPKRKLNHNHISYALDQFKNRKNGKSTMTVSAICKHYHIGRGTLYRYYKKWLAKTDPKDRAYYSSLFVDHDPKQKKNQQH